MKDGFVVDSSDTEEISGSGTEDEDEDVSDEPSDEPGDGEEDIVLEAVGSELSEESYIESDNEK